MKIKTLQEILKYKSLKKEFAILTNLKNGDSEIFIPNQIIKGEFSKYLDEIEIIFKSNKNCILENDKIFVQTCKNPIRVIIVGAVHIAEYLIDYAKSLNFEIIIIDPRGFFTSKENSSHRFSGIHNKLDFFEAVTSPTDFFSLKEVNPNTESGPNSPKV